MQLEESIQRKYSLQRQAQKSAEEMRLQRERELQNSRQTVAFLKDSRRVKNQEMRLMAAAEREQKLHHEFESQRCHASVVIDEERHYGNQSYRLQAFSQDMTHYKCPHTAICGTKVYAQLTQQNTNVSYYCHFNNAALLRHGVLNHTTQQTKQLPKLVNARTSRRYTDLQVLPDNTTCIVHGIRNRNTLDFLVCRDTETRCLSVPLVGITSILPRCNSAWLHPSHSMALLRWCISRLDVVHLVLKPAPLISLGDQNCPLVHHVLTRCLDTLHRSIHRDWVYSL